ncbi:hypothetical protein NC652_041329 [Populus alba x Populus x berolinensis]|nr:hypothetical protein NC652_041329 [Populus alba x Populus x berolinensis]
MGSIVYEGKFWSAIAPIGSKLRQEVSRVIGVAKESDFCNCKKPTDGCTICLRQRVVNLLTQKGFEASLCTSKWKNTRKHPGGSDEYRNLVALLPEYYVGKADYLNAIVGILCDAAKRSMKEKKIHMGPWRKRSFMQMKWSNCSERRSSSGKSFPSSRQAHESCLHLSAAPALTALKPWNDDERILKSPSGLSACTCQEFGAM